MCGIFGTIGSDRHAAALALSGLKDLEYRGYDSWGIAAIDERALKIKKAVGKIGGIEKSLITELIGNIAIGHSRWATHGAVTERNAHPHTNAGRTIAVVHNGIVENWQELKRELVGVRFVSETDTEVIPQLIDKHVKAGLTFVEACRRSARKLEGRFAFLAVRSGEDTLFAARSGSPLIVGKGEGQYYLASDVPAFLDYTQVVNYVDDGEYVLLSQKGAQFFKLENNLEVKKNDVRIEWAKDVAKKGNFEHFMLKEILEQRETLARSIQQDDALIERAAEKIKGSSRVLLLGCGTAGHVGETARYFFTQIAGKQVSFVSPSEFDLYAPFIGKDTLVVAISQSGETADVLDAVTRAKASGASILSVLNSRGSSLERVGDFNFLINAGPEIAVASTKATSSQLATLFLLAYAVRGELAKGKRIVLETVAQINEWLNPKFLEHVKRVANSLATSEHIYVIGRSYNYPIALEAALKIQEISYIHAEGFAGGEIKHGPIALITLGTTVIALVHEGKGKADILNNIAELRARGAYVVGISEDRHDSFDDWIHIPSGENIAPIVSLIPMHLVAYYLATSRLLDPDKPRNLAKSVTVR